MSSPPAALAGGLLAGVVLGVAGATLVFGSRDEPADAAGVADALAEENRRLRGELARARAGLLPEERADAAKPQDAASAALIESASPRGPADLQRRIDEALGRGDGVACLGLLAELAALGDVHLPAVAAVWARLAGMPAADLDRLGLSRMDLAAALARSASVMQHVLAEADLDATLRQFAARALEQAATSTRRAILADLDFAAEKDKAVLHALVRATEDIQDASYVDRFACLVARTDLYNDSRSGIAFRIAEIGGDEARAAIDRLRTHHGEEPLYRRMLPVLESLYAPPATGLLVTNGLPPAGDRIGHNDLILEYAGSRIRTRADLTRADAATKPGEIVAVKLLRGGAEHVLQITVTNTAPGHLHFDARPVVRR